MLDANLKTQLKGYLERLTMPVELVASLDGSPKSLGAADNPVVAHENVRGPDYYH